LRKDGRSQRDALANNLRANAADMVKAVHGGTMICRVSIVKVLLPNRAKHRKKSMTRHGPARLSAA
ncbi:MAG: hypothetical protein WBL98_18465, partial [Pseudolabrys sp.]